MKNSVRVFLMTGCLSLLVGCDMPIASFEKTLLPLIRPSSALSSSTLSSSPIATSPPRSGPPHSPSPQIAVIPSVVTSSPVPSVVPTATAFAQPEPIASVSPSPPFNAPLFLPTATAEPTPTPKPWPSHFTFQNPTNDPLAVVPIFSVNPHKRATTGTIAFISEINTTKDIYLMDSNGENRRNISDYLPYEESPVWSPDGKRIAFISSRAGNHIYLMNADGSQGLDIYNPAQLTETSAYYGSLSWNAHTNRLLFTVWGVPPVSPEWRSMASETAIIENGVYSAEVQGLRLVNLKRELSYSHMATSMDWSPDGSKIVFVDNSIGNEEIANNPNANMWASGRTTQIWLKDVTSGQEWNLSRNDKWDRDPSWSPDGQRIAFVSNRTGSSAIFTMTPQGTDIQQLTKNMSNFGNTDPSWSPDGKQIAYCASADSSKYSGDIFIMNADGSDQRRLTTTTPAQESWPRWQPGSILGE